MEHLAYACGVIAVGFDGYELHEEQRAFFSEHRFAGYILFARNVDTLAQTRGLTDSLRAIHDAGVPPMIAVDQEGGRVARLREGVEELPSMMALGAIGDAELARRAGEQLAFDLRRAGFTVDFAPSLDLAVDADNTVIGTRSFGADPSRVATLGRAVAAGMEDGGIVPTFKHFPGHGSTATDSHLAIPTIDVDEATFRARDLAPFREVGAAAHAFMSAHVVAPALGGDRPTTISRALLTDLLRGEFAFEGCCFTDCMQMDAIARGIGTAEGVTAAIAAGADCALVSHDPALALRAAHHLAEAVERGDVPVDRLREAHARVMTIRRRGAPALPLDLPAPHRGVGREIGRRAVTLIRGAASANPTSCIEVSFESATTEGVQGAHMHHASLTAQAPALARTVLPLDPREADVDRALERIVSCGRRAIVLARRAHVYPAQARAIDRIVAREPDALVVSLREPFDLVLFPNARHLVATYGDDAPSIAGLADVIFGGAEPEGKLPVDLEMHV